MNATRLQYINELMEGQLADYRRASDSFFAYLDFRSKSGFTPKQYEALRDNYFYRTQNTAISVAKVVVAAQLNGDEETFVSAKKNLFEELGEGNIRYAHISLLQLSFSNHGEQIFNVPSVSISSSLESPFLLPQAVDFRSQQSWCYDSRCYLVLLGASFAQESAANQMLESLYRALFLPFKSTYPSAEDFSAVARYFEVHIGGLEDEHAANAKEAILRRCHSCDKLDSVLLGMKTFLSAQSSLWLGLLRQLRSLERHGEAVPPYLKRQSQPMVTCVR